MKPVSLLLVVSMAGIFSACVSYPAPSNTESARSWRDEPDLRETTPRIQLAILGETRPTDAQRRTLRTVLERTEGDADYPRLCASIGVSALHMGALDEAAYGLDAMLAVAGSTLTDRHITERVLSLAGGEREKLFKGEPYERSMCFLWRGIVYLAQQDLDNAAACFRAAEVEDMYGSESDGYWVSARYLAYVADLWRGARPDPRMLLQQVEEIGFALPSTEHNTLIVFAIGNGPRKIHVTEKRGQTGLSYDPSETPVESVRLRTGIASEDTLDLLVADSLYVQAISRGRREMDAVLEAQERQVREKEGHAELAQGIGVVAANFGIFGLPVAAAAALFSISEREAAASADTVADLRRVWGLPAFLFVTTLDTSSENVTVELIDGAANVIASAEIEANREGTRRIVVARFR